MKHKTIFEMVFCAIMSCLAVILERYSIGSGFFKFTFYALPLIIVGIRCNLKNSLLTGVVSGFLMQLFSGYGLGITSIFWMLAPLSWCFITSLTMKLKIGNEKLKILIVVIIASISATFLNTCAMFMDLLLMNDSYYTAATIISNLPTRLINMVVLIVPYYLITVLLNESFKQIDKNRN